MELTNIAKNLYCKDISFKPTLAGLHEQVWQFYERINTGVGDHLKDLPHLALPLAASKGEMPRAHDEQNRTADKITAMIITKNITFRLMVKRFTCEKLVSVNLEETLQRYCNESPKIGKTMAFASPGS
jgi:hypothetical protein